MSNGSVVTFYSYKGGVGRSFLLANVAVILARWGYDVLCVDWDLEAPGLRHYFAPWFPEPRSGLLELVEGFDTAGDADWRDAAAPVRLEGTGGRLHLIAAGGRGEDYIGRVQALNWVRLYEEQGFGFFLERIRDQWKTEFDCILIDSRTGITDIGGICTVQLPDVLVCVAVANKQNVDGILEVVRRAADGRDRLPYDRGVLLTLPVISRFDAREEYDLSMKWLNELTKAFTPLFRNWLNEKIEPRDIIERCTIPYLSVWAFGENLPAVFERGSSPELISYPLETIAAILANTLARTDLLKESRDSYVALARRAAGKQHRFIHDVFISASPADRPLAVALSKAFQRFGLSVVVGHHELPRSPRKRGAVQPDLTRVQHLVGIYGPQTTTMQRSELEQFLKQAIEDRAERMVFPLLSTPDADAHLPSIVRNYQMRGISLDNVDTVAREIDETIQGLRTAPAVDQGVRARRRSERFLLADAPAHYLASYTPFANPRLGWRILSWAVIALMAYGAGALWQPLGSSIGIAGVDTRDVGLLLAVGVSGPWTVFLAVATLWVVGFVYAHVAFAAADALFVTPLFGSEHVYAFVINVVALFLIFIVLVGPAAFVGGAIFGLFGGIVLTVWLDRPTLG